MINWIIISVLIIAAVLALKLNHLRHKVWIILVILIALFLYTSVSLVYKENNLTLEKTEDVFSIARVYLGWLGNGFSNMKALTGNAVKIDWKSTNSSIITKKIT